MQAFKILNTSESKNFLSELECQKLQECGKIWLNKIHCKDRFIDIWFCTEKEIQELNYSFRAKNKITDILSWENDDDLSQLPKEIISDIEVGNIAICWGKVKEVAKEENWSIYVESCRLIVHGIVHIAGYDHELSEEQAKKMLQIEIDLLEASNMEFIYQDK